MQTTKCALFIDCENVPASLFEQIIDKLSAYQLCAKRAYANWRLGSPWSDILDHYGIEPVQVFHKGLKNSSDLRLSLDCLQMAYEREDISCFALVTSDSDFRHLVFKLLDMGREVIGFGESKTDNDFAGICSQFYKLENKENIAKEKVQTVPKKCENEYFKSIIWVCAGNDDFISINKINGKMISLYGKDWSLQKLGAKNWAGFLKNNAAFFDVRYKNEQNHTGMEIKLKEKALFKI